jgi:flagellar basal body P-ring formation protein FlgA
MFSTTMGFRVGVITLALLLLGAGQALADPGCRLSTTRAHALAGLCLHLRQHVQLDSVTMTLADLLPDSASASLRKEAATVPLGSAPQPGMTRILYRQQLQFVLRDHGAMLRRLALPDEIAVERVHHALTRQEVIRAIQEAVGSQRDLAGQSLDLQDVQFSTPVYVTKADPGLKVIRIESDPVRGDTQFQLWTSKEPNTLPFEVSAPGAVRLPTLVSRHALAPGEVVSATDFTIMMKPGLGDPSQKPPSAADFAGLETRAPLRAGQTVTPTEFGMPVLIRSGVLASLIVQGNSFSIKTVVTPLEQGVLGQEVQVRNMESRQVIEAKVIGRDQLLKEQ